MKFVFSFTNKKAEGQEDQKDLLGGKGARLHGMVHLGLPVPPGFTISTNVCAYFYANQKKYPKSLEKQVNLALIKIEKQMKRKLGSKKSPLLVSVRSGAPASMPGMMDTILNLGLNDETVEALAKESKDPRFAFDSYRRFITMYSNVVLGIPHSEFEAELENIKEESGVEEDYELSADKLKVLVQKFKRIVRIQGKNFPDDPKEQLWGAVGAVFGSWMNPRAITYRKLNEIPEHWGTAVTVQSMVFGNMGENCATGVAFTRDPSTGEKKFFGEFLLNAQGEDVVAGIRTPNPINASSRNASNQDLPALDSTLPKAYKQLVNVYKRLEKHYQDMQDIEFTIERGKLYMLQTRNGKRTAPAALRIAVEMVKEKLITKEQAIQRIEPTQLDQLMHPQLDPTAVKNVIARGLPASPGAATGEVVFDPDTAQAWKNEGKKVVLVRLETSPEDIHGMSAAQGILTARGGMTSHAAVVARGMGKCCVSGCGSLNIDYGNKIFSVGPHVLRQGDVITLDGSTGEVIIGEVSTIEAAMDQNFQELMKWVDEKRQLGIRANADTPHDSKIARRFGAQGIGLCRTEHMFFEPARIDTVREMILADTEVGRQKALGKILPMQRKDFKGIFEAMKGLPVTIRLLDPPLHEFIPHSQTELEALAQKIAIPVERLARKAESLKEFNPMLGHRGCRLGVSFPEIYRTQIHAIIEAACELYAEKGMIAEPEIMIPLVGDDKEFKFVAEYCRDKAEQILEIWAKKTGKNIPIKYKIGTMIELPRAALLADKIAETCEFFSFGTNDLTQTTYGLSRDDSSLFLRDYLNARIYEKDPFAVLDQAGVGALMEIGFKKGRSTNPDLKIGICGEHGGEPNSIEFCHNLGLDYVSCSPFRVPIARLAAAQAAINHPRKLKSTKATSKKKAKKKPKKKTRSRKKNRK